jgi:hypothetical protein
VTRCDGVVTLAGGEPAMGRGKGGDDVSLADTNLIEQKNREKQRSRFSCFKWTVKI